MPVEVDLVEQPDGDRVVGRLLQRRGDRVERELEVLQAPAIVASPSRFVVTARCRR